MSTPKPKFDSIEAVFKYYLREAEKEQRQIDEQRFVKWMQKSLDEAAADSGEVMLRKPYEYRMGLKF